AAPGSDRELLQVQGGGGAVLGDLVAGRELGQHPLDPHAGDRGARDRGEERAAKRVPHGVAEARLEGLDRELRADGRNDVLSDLRPGYDEHLTNLLGGGSSTPSP